MLRRSATARPVDVGIRADPQHGDMTFLLALLFVIGIIGFGLMVVGAVAVAQLDEASVEPDLVPDLVPAVVRR